MSGLVINGADNLAQDYAQTIIRTFGRDMQGNVETPAAATRSSIEYYYDENEALHVAVHGSVLYPRLQYRTKYLDLSDMDITVLPDYALMVEEGWEEYDTLEEVILPKNLVEIGAYAFSYCQNLKKVVFPTSLRVIGNAAFLECASLDMTSLPSGLETIGESAFFDCQQITISELPSGIKTVGNNAFRKCTSIESMTIPAGVEYGTGVFGDCASLTNVTLQNGCQAVPDMMFYDDGALVTVSFPNTITEIGNGAFTRCSSLRLDALPEGLTVLKSNAFAGCSSITISALPSSITTVGSDAFYRCTSIVNMEIGCSLSAGNLVFRECTGLEKVWIRLTCLNILASTAAKAPFVGCSDSLEIYAEPSAKLSGWGTYFNRTGTNGGTTVTVTFDQTTEPWAD